MEVFTTNSAAETKKLARQILKELKTNTIGLIGELGSGKTTFVQGLAAALGIKKRVISPSFVLIREYEIQRRGSHLQQKRHPEARRNVGTKDPIRGKINKGILRCAQNDAWRKGFIPVTKFFHVDLYRLEGKIDIVQLGLPEIWENKANLVIIEWAEKIKDKLPENSLILKFENLGENKRRIRISGN